MIPAAHAIPNIMSIIRMRMNIITTWSISLFIYFDLITICVCHNYSI